METTIELRKEVWDMTIHSEDDTPSPEWEGHRFRYISTEKSREEVLAVLEADIKDLVGDHQVFYRSNPSSHSERDFATQITYVFATARFIIYTGTETISALETAKLNTGFSATGPIGFAEAAVADPV